MFEWEICQSQSSSSSLLLMLKYFSSYVSFFGAMTCKKSRRFCFFKYFFVRYFRYRLENLISDVTDTSTFCFSLLTLIASPKFPVLPFTLMRSWKYFSSCATSMMLSSQGCLHSTKNFDTVFFVKVLPLPFSLPFPVFLPAFPIAAFAISKKKRKRGPLS